jgi:uroporphyrinogen-III decarboxylase
MVHICGNTSRLLPAMAAMRPDCFSLEAKVNLGRAREVLGGSVCVAGNVSPGGPLLTGTPQEVTAEAQACLAAWGPHPGLILATGCDFLKATPLANLKALMAFKDRAGQG